jgi:hypothetical protein
MYNSFFEESSNAATIYSCGYLVFYIYNILYFIYFTTKNLYLTRIPFFLYILLPICHPISWIFYISIIQYSKIYVFHIFLKYTKCKFCWTNLIIYFYLRSIQECCLIIKIKPVTLII